MKLKDRIAVGCEVYRAVIKGLFCFEYCHFDRFFDSCDLRSDSFLVRR